MTWLAPTSRFVTLDATATETDLIAVPDHADGCDSLDVDADPNEDTNDVDVGSTLHTEVDLTRAGRDGWHA